MWVQRRASSGCQSRVFDAVSREQAHKTQSMVVAVVAKRLVEGGWLY